MSSGSNSPSAVLPLNRYGGTYSLVQPESSTATDQRWLQTASTTSIPSAATDGVSTRSADSVIVQYSHDGDGTTEGAAQLYGYYTPQAVWMLLPTPDGDTSFDLTNTATQKSGVVAFDVQGASRVYLRISSLPSHATASTVDVYLLGRSAPAVTGA